MPHIPLFDLSKQHEEIETEVSQSLNKIFKNGEFTYGEKTRSFEEKFAHFCSAKYALGTRSGTAALFIALKAAGIGHGDEVITTPMTFTATADAIRLIGAKPVFIDVQADTGNINPSLIENSISNKTKAILIVHLYGVPCDLDTIEKIAKKNNLLLIEDSSHAHGSKFKKRSVGSFGLAGCFSLYPSKTLGAIGNAGVITTNNKAFVTQARMFAHHGIKQSDHKYKHFVSGYNELIDNIQASVLEIKMKHLQKWIQQKRVIVNYYNKIFYKLGHKGMVWGEESEPSFYVYAFQEKKRPQFQKFMKSNSIETGIYYPIPLHLQPAFSDLGYKKGDFPVAEKFASQTVSLPLYPGINTTQLSKLQQALNDFYS